MPGNFGCWVEVLKYLTNKAGTPRQASHRGDLAIGRNPAFGDAGDYSANRRDRLIALEWGSPEQLAHRRHRQLSSIPVVVFYAIGGEGAFVGADARLQGG